MKCFSFVLMLVTLSSASRAADERPVDFLRQIKPLFEDRCVECHNSETLLGELNLESREHAFQKRKAGPVIVPNKPEASLLYLVLKLPSRDKKAMPATGHRIPPDEVATVRQWIAEGAAWPTRSAGMLEVKHPKEKR